MAVKMVIYKLNPYVKKLRHQVNIISKLLPAYIAKHYFNEQQYLEIRKCCMWQRHCLEAMD